MNPYYKFEEWKINSGHSYPQECLKPQLQNLMLVPSNDGGNDAGMDLLNAGRPLDLGAGGTTSATVEEISDSLGSTNLSMGPSSWSEHNSLVADEASVSSGNIELTT